MKQLKFITLAAAMCIALAACDDHPSGDDQALVQADQAKVDQEVQTPLQKSYDSIDDCKKEFSTDGDCTTQTIIVDNQPRVVFFSPFYYPWGAIYHPGGFYSYGHTVPVVTSRVVTTTLPASAARPNYSNASSYSSSRTASMSSARASSSSTASRGGFGGTARGASSSSSGSSGGSSGGG
jgi:hypothetical protein